MSDTMADRIEQEYKHALDHWEWSESRVLLAREAYEKAIIIREEARVRAETALAEVEKS